MSRKQRTREEEIALEVSRLDDALDELVEQLSSVLPMSENQPQVMALQKKLRREAAQAMADVSERKAKLLGLDAPERRGADSGTTQAGTLAELEQKLALAARAGGAGKSS